MVALTSNDVKTFSVAFHHVIKVLLGCVMIISISKNKRHGCATRESTFMIRNVSRQSFLQFGTHLRNLNLPLNLMSNYPFLAYFFNFKCS